MFKTNKITFKDLNDRIKFELKIEVAIYLLLFLFVALSFRYQYLLLNFKEWGDESETIVTSKMMAAGMKLYSEIFNHHGPLTFFTGLILEKIGDFGVLEHRVPIAFLQIMAILSIYKSPALNLKSQKIIASIFSATVFLLFMPKVFGHMYKYQNITGLILIIILSQYTIPAILCPDKVSLKQTFLGNLLISSLPFLAITYLPITGLFFIVSLRRQYLKGAVFGTLIGLTGNLLFLGFYGSFAGFMAFHLYLNAKILPLYGMQLGIWSIIVNAFNVATSNFAQYFSFIAMLISGFILAIKEERFPWRTILLIIGFYSLLIRGPSFHSLPFYYSILPLISMNLRLLNTDTLSSKKIFLGFLLLSLIKISLILPRDLHKFKSAQIPTETEFSKLVAEFTSPKDKIIAYTFQNFQYIISDRLPASGHFFFLPWQEKYNENPKFGILIDACKQIKETAPKVMLIDKWKVWDRFEWEGYAGCIQKLLDANYRNIPGKPYYIRKDLLRGFDNYKFNENQKMISSSPLNEGSSIKLKFNHELMKAGQTKKLVAIEIMFNTYIQVQFGKAQIILEKESGEKTNLEMNLTEILDNKYKHFYLPEDSYISGEIKWLTGGGISAWESVDNKEKALTCMKYVFADGSHGYTPGCPIL